MCFFVGRTQKDNDKAIYQTLVRKGRRGSLNNARRMYEDKMNLRKVRQYMQNITVISNEEKLLEMSKVVEAAAGRTFDSHQHKVTFQSYYFCKVLMRIHFSV